MSETPTILPNREVQPSLEEENALIRRFQGGDPSAFDGLYRGHIKPLNAFLWKLHGNPATPIEEIEDLGQDTMMVAYKSLGRFRSQSRFRTWLFGIALNLFRDRLRKKKKAPAALDAPMGPSEGNTLLETLPAAGPETHEGLFRREILAEVEAALGEMPLAERELIVLRDLEGMTTQEVADLTGQGVRSVQIFLERAHRRLRESLEKKGFSLEETPT